jgi:hypothetical protein
MAGRKMRDFPMHIQIMLGVFEAADKCRRENNALRSILRKQGLSDAAIQGRVRRLLKMPEMDIAGARLLKQVCEESLKHFDETYLATLLSGARIKGKVQ